MGGLVVYEEGVGNDAPAVLGEVDGSSRLVSEVVGESAESDIDGGRAIHHHSGPSLHAGP